MNTPMWIPPLIQPENLTRVSPHVHTITDGLVAGVPNVGIVIGSRAALVVDTGIGERNGQTVLRIARELAGSLPLRLITTHVHPEHDLGAQAFPADTVMIRSSAQIAEIAENGLKVADDFRVRSADYAELLDGASFRDADIIFEESVELDLGGVRVQIRAMGPNHTPGDTVAFVIEDSVLFSGDIAMALPASFASPYSTLSHWLSSLDALEALRPRVIVPSHGPLGGIELIEGYRRYFHDVSRLSAAAQLAGAGYEQAAAEIVPKLIDTYPDAGRIMGAVAAAYREAENNKSRKGHDA